jgi:hypothetical protein
MTGPSASKAPAPKRAGDWGLVIRWIVGLACVAWAGAYVAPWLFPASEWATKWRYTFETDLWDASVVIDKQPHDCEFLTAPIGKKNCHYERLVTTVRVRRLANGVCLVSYDEARTWTEAKLSARPVVYVSWNKIDE